LKPAVREQNGVENRSVSVFDFVSKPVTVTTGHSRGKQRITLDALVGEFDYAVVISA